MNSESINAPVFSSSELKLLRELTSFDFGFIKFNTPKGQIKKQILEKAILSLDTHLAHIVINYKEKKEKEESELLKSQNGKLEDKQKLELYEKYSNLLIENTDSYYFLYLGHFQLLLNLYEDSLSAYLQFESRNIYHWRNIHFLYGLAICYFHFSAFEKSIELFQTILYLQPSCIRAKEINIRLGYTYKINKNFESSLKHFKQALNDSTKGSFSESEIRFQIAHLLEVCGKYKQAQKAYEQLIGLNKDEVPDNIKHLCYRQLGWLHFSGYLTNPAKNQPPNPNSLVAQKKDTVISLLNQAINLDDSSGKTWYLFGRAQAKENKVQEAFMAYRNSIDKTEANADTWCSIGVLYQEQNQPMDALQAYFCACQLDRKHIAAWTNLGVLYESMDQHKEALKCYQNAISADKHNEIRPEIKERMVLIQKLLSTAIINPENGASKTSSHNGQNPAAQNGTMMLQQKMRGGPTPGAILPPQQQQGPNQAGMVMKLPTVDEAWNLPIPTELTQRQMQLEMQEVVASSNHHHSGANAIGNSNNAAGTASSCNSIGGVSSRLFAHNIPQYVPNVTSNSVINSQGQTATTPNNNDINHLDGNQIKRRKIEDNQESVPLTPQQTQLLLNLESKINQLSSQEHATLVQLQSQLHKYNINQQRAQHQDDIKPNIDQLKESQLSTSTQSLHNNTGHSSTNVATTNSAADDLHLINSFDEIPDVYEHEFMANIDALLSDPINNFCDEPFGDDQSQIKKEPCTAANTNSDEHQQQQQQPVTDLLNYLRHYSDQTKPVLVCPLDQFNINMTSTQIIDQVSRFSLDIQDKPWSITYLPGNRIPKPPTAPAPPPVNNQSFKSTAATGNNNNNTSTSTNATNVTSSISKQNSEYFQLLPPTPSVYLDCKKDVHSPELRQFCLSQPVVVIRNLASTLRMDLGVFSTKSLVDANPNHKIEQRIQDSQPADENKDASGNTIMECLSTRGTTTIQEYANYQSRTFAEAKKEEKSSDNNNNSASTPGSVAGVYMNGAAGLLDDAKLHNSNSNDSLLSPDDKSKRVGSTKPSTGGGGSGNANNNNASINNNKPKRILFGTNCDLSDESKWFSQLHELNKLPQFLRVVSACNMLSHVNSVIQGMNTVQLYMKVPGCRTPGHQENNQFCSVNMNVGPGDCEWFCVPEQYWGAINNICESHGLDYLSGSWWPNLEELRQHHIPLYRYIQRPGDLVWINSGTVHWVQAIGWCNNIAWNVGPLVSRQYSLAMERYEYNKLRHYQSIVPMLHLSWQLARNIKITESHLFQLIKHTLMVSLIHTTLIWNYLEKSRVPLVHQPREENEPIQTCVDCDSEVFNIFLIKKIKSSAASSTSATTTPNSKKPSKDDKDATYETRCLNCALKLSPNLHEFKSIYQYKLSELKETFDSFKFQTTPISAYSVSR